MIKMLILMIMIMIILILMIHEYNRYFNDQTKTVITLVRIIIEIMKISL